MSGGKTIQIYLPDGIPRSLKIAEITSRTVQAILIPRSKLRFASTRPELQSVGIYFLLGDSDGGVTPLVYVGEAENCLSRLKQQNRDKEFWTSALAIVSRTQQFTRVHGKYLEWFCYREAKRAGRYRVLNPNEPNKPFVPEPILADLDDNFGTIKILVSTLGYPIFDRIPRPPKRDLLICKGKDALAQGEYTEDGLVVFADSKCNLRETPSAGSWLRGMRDKLMEDGILVREGKVLKFTSDYVFSSPSAAAGVVLARRANGWTKWKFPSGKTLDELIRKGPKKS